jgi:hypothetical protein
MKNILLIFTVFNLLFSGKTFSQCNVDSLIYLRDFNTTSKAIKYEAVKWPVILNRRTIYKFCFTEGFDKPANSDYYWRTFKTPQYSEMQLINYTDSSITKIKSSYENGVDTCCFDYDCPKSGKYYIMISAKDTSYVHRYFITAGLFFAGRVK